MVLPFEASGLNNIVDGIELVPEWLSGASNREEAHDALITLCHRFDVDGAILFTCDIMDCSTDWSVSLSSFTSPEYDQINKCPDVQNILKKRIFSSQVGLITAELLLPGGDKQILFVRANKKNTKPAVLMFVSKNKIKFTRLAELRLASDVIWNLMSGFHKIPDQDNQRLAGRSRIERQVVDLQRRGCSSRQISEQLGLSPHTVFHLMQYVAKKYDLN